MKQLNEPYFIGFEFYKYIKPTLLPLYFPAGDVSFAPFLLLDGEYNGLAKPVDSGYQTELAHYYDLGYNLHNQLLLPRRKTAEIQQLLKKYPPPSLQDNYRFIRRHFPRHWLYYILFRRVLEFKNPLKELAALKNSALPAISPEKTFIPENTSSRPTDHKVAVSIIVATLNRPEQLKKLLVQLEHQTVLPVELIIIDQSEQPLTELFSTHFRITYLQQTQKGQASARNKGINKATGEYLLFTDDDCEVPDNWIEKHLETFHRFPADASSGPFFERLGKNPIPQPPIYSYALQLPAGNFMAKKSFFEQVGLFDESLDGSPLEDTELYARAYHKGMVMICHDAAAVKHLKYESGGMRDWNKNHPAYNEVFLQLMQKYYPTQAWKNILQAEQVKELLPYNQADKGLLQKLNMLWQLPFILYLSARMISKLKLRQPFAT